VNRPAIVVVTSGFPRYSETFLLNELLALDERGMIAGVFATKPGDDMELQPGTDRLLERVQVLTAPDPEGQAAELVAALDGRRVTGVHGYFAHTPAEVARTAARRLGVPWGFSVHARDARKIPAKELAARAHEAAVVVACNADVADEVWASGAAVTLMAHGVDLGRFRARPFADGPFTVLAVGRFVEKKGFDVLVRAIAAIETPVCLRLIGAGSKRAKLQALVAELGIEDRVHFAGPRTHDELPAAFAHAHVVAVPSVVDTTGDRDGLPNVVLEAMASGRPVVGTDVGAIARAVVDGATGYIVAPHDPDALANRIQKLALDRELMAAMGRAARELAEERFSLHECTERLATRFAQVYG